MFAADQTVEVGRGGLVHLGDTLSVSKFDPHSKDALHQWAARRSLLLYSSNPEARSRQTNWEVNVVTPANNKLEVRSDQDRVFVSNRDFGVMFHSRALTDPNAGSGVDRPGDRRADSDPIR